jgi:hypothetical protein
MWTTQRKNTKGLIMDSIEIFQLIFLIIVFAVGVLGFIKAATKND